MVNKHTHFAVPEEPEKRTLTAGGIIFLIALVCSLLAWAAILVAAPHLYKAFGG